MISLKGQKKRWEGGTSLIEVVVGLALLGLVGTGFMLALSTTSISSSVVQVQATADNLARSQMEYVKDLPYQAAPTTYPALAAPPDYTISAQAFPVPGADDYLQKVEVTVTRGGKTLLVLEGMKMNR